MKLFPVLDPDEYSPLMLAYIGDCLFDLYFRMHCAKQEKRQVRLAHRRVVDIVNAREQARILRVISDSLPEEDRDLCRRTRNRKMTTHPKGVSMSEYRQATALEALFGFYFMKQDDKALSRLFNLVEEALNSDE